MSSVQLEGLNLRIDNLEKREEEGFVTMVEMLSTVTFFGGIKKNNCEYAKDGQCSVFYLKDEAKGKIPIATDCRISECDKKAKHCHLEISNITCNFCPRWNNKNNIVSNQKSPRRKKKRQKR